MTIEPLFDCDSDQCLGYCARGHHPAKGFLDAIRREYDQTAFDPARVQHIYYRVVPYQSDYATARFIATLKPGRGAFPVTVINL